MALQLTKSYRLLRFLNRRHGVVVWGAFTLGAYVYALVATGHHGLAKGLSACFYKDRDFKLGLRRATWFMRVWFPGFKLIPNDPMFDFTEGLGGQELDAVDRLLERRRPRLDPAEYQRFALSVAAHRAESERDQASRAAARTAFAQHGDALLASMPSPPDPNGPVATLPPAEHFREGDFNIADARTALHDFAALFPNSDVPWFVISGTFLGLIREDGFLRHDYDIDLGAMADDIDLAAILSRLDDSNAFVIRKFDVTPDTSERPSVPTLIKILHRRGVHLDLFIHYREETKDRGLVIWHGSSLHRWENAVFSLVPYSFEGIEVLGPDNSDLYLTENYGNWRQPVTNFSCTTDTPNMVVMPRPKSLAIFLNRLYLEASKPGQYPLALREMLLASGALIETGQNRLKINQAFF